MDSSYNIQCGNDVIDALKEALGKLSFQVENYLDDFTSTGLDSTYWSSFEAEVEDCWLEAKQARQNVEDFFESKDEEDD